MARTGPKIRAEIRGADASASGSEGAKGRNHSRSEAGKWMETVAGVVLLDSGSAMRRAGALRSSAQRLL